MLEARLAASGPDGAGKPAPRALPGGAAGGAVGPGLEVILPGGA